MKPVESLKWTICDRRGWDDDAWHTMFECLAFQLYQEDAKTTPREMGEQPLTPDSSVPIMLKSRGVMIRIGIRYHFLKYRYQWYHTKQNRKHFNFTLGKFFTLTFFVVIYLYTGSFRINTHDIIVSYAQWENFYAPGMAALCSAFHAVFVQGVVRTREHD